MKPNVDSEWIDKALAELKRLYENTGGAHTLELILEADPDYDYSHYEDV